MTSTPKSLTDPKTTPDLNLDLRHWKVPSLRKRVSLSAIFENIPSVGDSLPHVHRDALLCSPAARDERQTVMGDQKHESGDRIVPQLTTGELSIFLKNDNQV